MTSEAAGRIAAVVVTYESGSALARCASDLASAGVAELVVVDNGSGDGSVDEARTCAPTMEVLAPGRNLGFGAGVNRGVAATTSPLILVCNPDLKVPDGALAALATAVDADPRRAAAGPLIRTPTGDRYPSARHFPSLVDAAGHAVLGLFRPNNRFTRSYQRAELDVSGAGTTSVDWVSGACFLIRRQAFEAVGGFDESYFMYAEDVDLCWRLGRAGWSVVYEPAAEVTHLQGTSTDHHPYRMIIEHHRSLFRFASRTTEGTRRVLLPLVAAGLVGRCTVAIAVRLGRSRRSVSGRSVNGPESTL